MKQSLNPEYYLREQMVTDLLFWVVVLSVTFPLLIVILTEVRQRLRNDTAIQLVRITTNSTLPLIVLWVLLEKVFLIPRDNTFFKVVETLCWISIINMALLLVNTLLFTGRPESERPAKVLMDFLRFLLILIGTGIVLAFVWDVDLRGVITTLGVGTIIIGFALQDTLGNIVSGFLTLVRRPFIVGDKVMIGDIEGEVREITWNSVVVRRPDRSLAILPQADVGKRAVINLTRATGSEHSEVIVEFSRQHPPNTVKRVLMTTLLSTPGVENSPAPLVRTVEHTDINIRYSIRFWTARNTSPLETRDQFLTRLWYVAKRYNLRSELPTRRIYQTTEERVSQQLLVQQREELATVPLLFKMGSEVLEYVANGAEIHEYGSGEYVIHEGEMVNTLFVVVQGDAKAVVSDSNGSQRRAFALKYGEFFGESSLFSGRPSPYSVVALNDMNAVLLDREMVNRLIEKEATLVKEIGRVISERREKIQEVLVR
jgi:small-conductance mechanosensitive channel